ncbi:MAG: hypothetical protein ATN35_07785 [Epulopiscium sp. Nele67-Bin004]|nr:MAG: hypothetical protein ATN35_07785 [Epulopiscium sp. Nele67-Bin004]
MAKAKKAKLSLDELVEQALVAEDEKPYDVPDNWVWCRLSELVTIKGGKRLPKDHVLIDEKTKYPYIRVTDFGDNTINIENIKYLEEETQMLIKNYTVSNKDVYISIAGTIGKVGIIPIELEGANLTENAAKITPSRGIDKKYLLYLLQSYYLEYQIDQSTLSSTQPKLALFRIGEFKIPLSLIKEQKRIASTIDSMFRQLDKARELVQTALESFENRKLAILHKAFTGELTAKWREENGVSFDSWEEKKLGEYISTKYGYTESASKEEVGPKFVRITDIQDGNVDWSKVPYCTISNEEFQKYGLKINDILVARTGATTGKSYIVEQDVKAVFASYLIRVNILPNKKLLPKYLWSYMQSILYWNQIIDIKQGIAQPGVNANKLKELDINIPTLAEQIEIVHILDNLLTNEQQAQQLCNLLEKIDLMKKSILARAFRGELGTNNPDDENAIELLKEVLADKL